MQKLLKLRHINLTLFALFVFLFFASFVFVLVNHEIALLVNILLMTCIGQMILVSVMAPSEFAGKRFWAYFTLVSPAVLCCSLLASSDYKWMIGLSAIFLPLAFLYESMIRQYKIVKNKSKSQVLKIVIFYWIILILFLILSLAMLIIDKPLIALYCNISFVTMSIILLAWFKQSNKQKNRVTGLD